MDFLSKQEISASGMCLISLNILIAVHTSFTSLYKRPVLHYEDTEIVAFKL
jgi:hypothetical protein